MNYKLRVLWIEPEIAELPWSDGFNWRQSGVLISLDFTHVPSMSFDYYYSYKFMRNSPQYVI